MGLGFRVWALSLKGTEIVFRIVFQSRGVVHRARNSKTLQLAFRTYTYASYLVEDLGFSCWPSGSGFDWLLAEPSRKHSIPNVVTLNKAWSIVLGVSFLEGVSGSPLT